MVALSPERLNAMMQPPSGEAAPGAATPPEPAAGPLASPMSTPEPKMGSREGALVNLSMARDLIEQALPALGADSDLGAKVMGALKALSGALGPKAARTDELQPAEIMQLLGSLPQAGNVTPEVAATLGPGAQTPPKPVAPPVPPPQGGPMPGGQPGAMPM